MNCILKVAHSKLVRDEWRYASVYFHGSQTCGRYLARDTTKCSQPLESFAWVDSQHGKLLERVSPTDESFGQRRGFEVGWARASTKRRSTVWLWLVSPSPLRQWQQLPFPPYCLWLLGVGEDVKHLFGTFSNENNNHIYFQKEVDSNWLDVFEGKKNSLTHSVDPSATCFPPPPLKGVLLPMQVQVWFPGGISLASLHSATRRRYKHWAVTSVCVLRFKIQTSVPLGSVSHSTALTELNFMFSFSFSKS